MIQIPATDLAFSGSTKKAILDRQKFEGFIIFEPNQNFKLHGYED